MTASQGAEASSLQNNGNTAFSSANYFKCQEDFMSKTSLDEQIANALVNNAVKDGFQISINKGDEAIVNRSRNSAEITKAMFRTNIETLTLNVEERRVGIITLVYGNTGLSVISDYTDAPHINRLVEHTLKELEPGSTPRLQEPDEPLGHPAEKTG